MKREFSKRGPTVSSFNNNNTVDSDIKRKKLRTGLTIKAVAKKVRLKFVREDNTLYRLVNTLG